MDANMARRMGTVGSILTALVAMGCRPATPQAQVAADVAAPAEVEAIDCDTVIPAELRARVLPRRTLVHERSCDGATCFADTCSYRRGPSDVGVQVVVDCRADANG